MNGGPRGEVRKTKGDFIFFHYPPHHHFFLPGKESTIYCNSFPSPVRVRVRRFEKTGSLRTFTWMVSWKMLYAGLWCQEDSDTLPSLLGMAPFQCDLEKAFLAEPCLWCCGCYKLGYILLPIHSLCFSAQGPKQGQAPWSLSDSFPQMSLPQNLSSWIESHRCWSSASTFLLTG